MKNITCDFCEKPIAPSMVVEMQLVLHKDPSDPTPMLPRMWSWDVCVTCAANFRKADKIHIAIAPPKK
jgi:hypothetical protein